MSTQKNNTVKMTEIAILVATIIMFQCLASFVKLPFMATASNLVLVPIALGACLLGPASGALLGFICGFFGTFSRTCTRKLLCINGNQRAKSTPRTRIACPLRSCMNTAALRATF